LSQNDHEHALSFPIQIVIHIINIQYVEAELNLFKALFYSLIMNQSLSSSEHLYDYSTMLHRVPFCIIIIIIIINGRLNLNQFWLHIFCRPFFFIFALTASMPNDILVSVLLFGLAFINFTIHDT